MGDNWRCNSKLLEGIWLNIAGSWPVLSGFDDRIPVLRWLFRIILPLLFDSSTCVSRCISTFYSISSRRPMLSNKKAMTRLPATAVADACVYQNDCGCSLPRWMRGDMCNGYRCKGLSHIDYLIRYKGASRAFVVERKDNRIVRAAFVNRDTISHYLSTEN